MSCVQFNFASQSSAIKTLQNVTQVKNYANPATPTWIVPYARPEVRGAPDCSFYYEYECGDGTNSNKYCYTPLLVDFETPIDLAATKSYLIGTLKNNFALTTNSISYPDTCLPYVGFKNVVAKKMWHGAIPLTSKEYGKSDTIDYCVACGVQQFSDVPVSTKYLSMSASAKITYNNVVYNCPSTEDGYCDDCGDGARINWCPECTLTVDEDFEGTAFTSITVNRYTGELIVNGTGSAFNGDCESDPNCESSYTTDAWNLLVSVAGTNNGQLLARYAQVLASYSAMPIGNVSGTNTHWTVEYYTDHNCYDHCSVLTSTEQVTIAKLELDLAGNTLDIYTYGISNNCRETCTCGDCCEDWVELSHEHWGYTDVSVFYTLDAKGIGSVSLDDSSHKEATMLLTDPYTGNDAYADALALLNLYPMGDDISYPWRTDLHVNQAPLVSYDEVGPTIPFVSLTGSAGGSGVVLGAPFPLLNVSGTIYRPDRIWNGMHSNYCICDSFISPGCLSYYVRDYGAWNDGGTVPPCATQWTDGFQTSQLPHGAFVLMNQGETIPSTCNYSGPSAINDDVIWVGKYAEIIIPKPHYNYSRPCGEDRFMPELNTERCIVTSSGQVLTLSEASTFANNNYVFVLGTTNLDGLWKATVNSATEIELQGNRYISASSLPSLPFPDGGTGLIYKLKWQNLKPSICSTMSLYDANNSSPITCSFTKPTYLINNDNIVVFNAGGMTGLNGSWNVIYIDNMHVALSGSDGRNKGTYTKDSAKVTTNWSADPMWDTTKSQHKFSIVTTHPNLRHQGEKLRIDAQSASLAANYTCDGVAICNNYSIPTSSILDLDDNTVCSQFTATPLSCHPMVAYFAPSGSVENFAVNATNVGWASNISIDHQYGTKWLGGVVQAMDDPLGQPAPCPCTAAFASNYCMTYTVQDDGTCNENTIDYSFYAKYKQFEPICVLPVNAPLLPSGSHLFCDNSASCAAPTLPYPNDVFANGVGCYTYATEVYRQYWDDYLKMYYCVCANGRFASNYKKNKITC